MPEPVTDEWRQLDARFAADPDALAWARGHVKRLASRYREFEQAALRRGDKDMAARWKKFANLLEMELVGGTGCVIRPFDERRPVFAAMDEGNPDA